MSSQQPSTSARDFLPESKPLSLAQQLAVSQQIAQLVRAKRPIVNELPRMAANSSSEIRQAAKIVDERIAAGASLDSALAGDDSRNSKSLSACITAGELGQGMDRLLESWSSLHLANQRSTLALRNAMLYPTLLIVVTLVSVGSVVWRIIPEYQSTYAQFDQQLPSWLQLIAVVREHVAWLLLGMLLCSFLPLWVWYRRRQQYDQEGLPREPVRRMRMQSLAAEVARSLLAAGRPLSEVTCLSSQATGGNTEVALNAFKQLQQQQQLSLLSSETNIVLASLRVGVVESSEAIGHLAVVAEYLRDEAYLKSLQQARWVPMLVALVVGGLVLSTYVFLIYLPWVLLLIRIVAPQEYQL